ncbi:MAG: DinB family protein [Acidobacteriaceae bacterium]
MDLLAHFQMLARYNRLANERLYEKCAQLDSAEYQRQRPGSFASIRGLLNHILRGDQIWMPRFEGTNQPAQLASFDTFPELQSARCAMDAHIESFFAQPQPGFLDRPLTYVNTTGQQCTDDTSTAVAHLFNHQTHHRGQVHVMLAQTSVAPPALDLHRIIHP